MQKPGLVSSRMPSSTRPPTSGFNTDATGTSGGFAQRISTVNRPGSRVGTAAIQPASAMRAVTSYNYVIDFKNIYFGYLWIYCVVLHRMLLQPKDQQPNKDLEA